MASVTVQAPSGADVGRRGEGRVDGTGEASFWGGEGGGCRETG